MTPGFCLIFQDVGLNLPWVQQHWFSPFHSKLLFLAEEINY